jgi:preprotein translocase subunit YajC
MSSAGFLLIVVAFGFLYFVLIRPQKKRQLQARQMLDQLAIGDEVVTAGGIYGRVTELLDDAVMVEISPALQVKVARRAIGTVIPPAEEPAEPVEPEAEAPPAVENDG